MNEDRFNLTEVELEFPRNSIRRDNFYSKFVLKWGRVQSLVLTPSFTGVFYSNLFRKHEQPIWGWFKRVVTDVSNSLIQVRNSFHWN